MEWEQLHGTGRLVAVTCISFPPPDLARQGYGRDNPYCTGVVELDDNARIVARIKGIDTQNPDAVSIGMPVEIVFRDPGDPDGVKPIVTFQPR